MVWLAVAEGIETADWLARGIALVGVVLAAASFVWQVVAWLGTGPRVLVAIEKLVAVGNEELHEALEVSAINKGRTPITVRQVALSFRTAPFSGRSSWRTAKIGSLCLIGSSQGHTVLGSSRWTVSRTSRPDSVQDVGFGVTSGWPLERSL